MRQVACGANFAPSLARRSCGEAINAKGVVAQWGPSGCWPRSIPVVSTAPIRRRPPRRVGGPVPGDDECAGQPLGLRTVGRGVRRHEPVHRLSDQLDAPPGSIADRLSNFTANGVLIVSDNRYRLTEKGRTLFSVLVASPQWAQRWFRVPDGPAVILTHTGCGKRLSAVPSCDQCPAPLTGAQVTAARG